MRKSDNEHINRIRYYNLYDNGKCKSALKKEDIYFKTIRYRN